VPRGAFGRGFRKRGGSFVVGRIDAELLADFIKKREPGPDPET
jgi:hypothetical protein